MTFNSYPRCRIGIIGAGRIGKLHAETIYYHLPQFKLIGIADPHVDTRWVETLPNLIHYADPQVLIEHPEIDAILIASPSEFHLSQIQLVSATGKAIFCEKPLGLDEEEILSTLKLIKTNQTLLQLGFNRRFDPDFAFLKQQISQQNIIPHIIKITSRDPACPPVDYCATSGGLFYDMSIHDFDMARYLSNSEVVEVYASGAILINPQLEAFNDIDTAIVQLRFANGSLGVIDNSRQAVYGYDQRIEVFGANGMLVATNQQQHGVQHYTNQAIISANPHYFFLERYQQAYRLELQAFYQTWLQKTEVTVSGFDGLQALRIAKAAKQSLETHLPVSLPLETL